MNPQSARTTLSPQAAVLPHSAESAIREIGIPAGPAVLTELVREMRADEPDLKRAADLISRDVTLAVTTVQTANSPCFELRSPVRTIPEALNCVGLRTISGVIAGLLLRQAFPMLQGPAIARFWEDSARIASLTANVARALRVVDPGLAYAFGLFRDCGMPVMLCKYRDYTKTMADAAFGSAPTLPTEMERYQTHHAAVGLQLARKWQLAEVLCGAIEQHHDQDALYGGRGDIEPDSMHLIACSAIADHLHAVRLKLTQRRTDNAVGLACAQLGLQPARLDSLAVEAT